MATFRGRLSVPDDSGHMTVTATILDGEFKLETDDEILGSWPIAQIRAEERAGHRFLLHLGNEEVVFQPAGVEAFAKALEVPPPALTERIKASAVQSPSAATTVEDSAPRPGMSQGERVAVGICGVLIVIGSLLPWASAGIFTVAGTEGDGIITLVLGLVVGGTALISKGKRKMLSLIILVAGSLSLIVSGNIANNFSFDVEVIGTGLVLVILASLVAAVMGLGGFFSKGPVES